MERLINYEKGQPHGPTVLFNDFGIRIQEGGYRNGLEDGEWKFYTTAGELEFIGSYKDGNPTGTWYQFVKGKRKVYKKY
ncbi:MAG: hypothetical protein IPK96_09625 [Flammeovirgaceae bacterium]|nr:hypothetical protein [Flammeovirgaceae bacterium]